MRARPLKNVHLTRHQALAATADRHEGPALVYGHDVLYDEDAEKLVLKPSTAADTPRYFVPDPEDDFTAKGFGQYCNDLAFEAGMNDENSYLRRSEQSNVAQLVWRLEFDDASGELRVSRLTATLLWSLTRLTLRITTPSHRGQCRS